MWLPFVPCPVVTTSFFKRLGTAITTTLFVLAFMHAPAWSEPTGFEPLHSTIIGQGDQDAQLQAIWDGTLRPKMQVLSARFETPTGTYLLSIKKDRCINTGNVANVFACPARLALISAAKPVAVQDYAEFYFSGELPTSNTVASYIEQSDRNNTRIAIDPSQGTLLVQDTSNGRTGTSSLTFTKP